ncbi:phage tail protein [Edwardsiella tarda]|uniref:phage tail protein n=1 Tax=Edwardsiella tarda TaxID=636 RepID=UPI00098F39BE|nr:phage tail protein [Edwardsiella tarda]
MTEKNMAPRIKLPVWMNKGQVRELADACRVFWQGMVDWLMWPLRQLDVETCSVPVLELIAYQRDISRFKGEPLSLYRKRVKFAFINAKEAGSVAGFIAIFQRLGVGYVELRERQPGLDWDVIVVRVSDSQVSDNTELLMEIIQHYGRTCRRYRFEVITASGLQIRCGWVGCEYVCYGASIATPVSGRSGTTAAFHASLRSK